MEFSKDKNDYFSGFYRARVEDNNDPENRGRVKVRILGLHSFNDIDDKEDGIPKENLPFAEQAAPIFGGFGNNKAGIMTVPEINSWVWVFFDSGNFNKPVYFATIVGNNDFEKTDFGESFKDDITRIKTKSGHLIEINDKEKEENITIVHKNGHSITINQLNNKNIIVINVPDGTIKLDAEKIILGKGDQYPLYASSPNQKYIINGQVFYSAKKTSVG